MPTRAPRSEGRSGPSIVIAAGGTGGHIYPGLALAEAIEAEAPDATIAFVGTPKGMEGELVPKAGYPLHLYDMVMFAGQGWRKALAPPALARASLQARRVIRRVRADVAVSMGGYSGIPLVVGARLAGIPAIVYEPGSVPGKANLLAARFTRHIATSFPQTRFPSREVDLVGYQLRLAMTAQDRDALRPEARAAYSLADGTRLVLVSGGSQGSLRLNALALGLAERWAGRTDVRILLKAGARNHVSVAKELADSPGASIVDLVKFIDRIEHAYAAADFAICRAGAATVSELALFALPSVLVPFPYDEHDEQLHNAEPLVDAGGALLVRDADATPDIVGPMLETRLDDAGALAAMGAAARSCARPGGAANLARKVLELAS